MRLAQRYFTIARALLAAVLKINHLYSEKNSTSRKFETFVSRLKVPGERLFVFAWGCWLMCTPIANAQPWSSWKVPANLGPAGWQVNLIQGTVLLSSPHSNWLYAYSPDGDLLWKRALSWPLSESPRLVDGLLLIQSEGQPAILVQPTNGELRQRLPRSFSGWTVRRDAQSWLQLRPDGKLLEGSKDWTEWREVAQLRLEQGDHWLGPPALGAGKIYLGTARGHLQSVDLGAWQVHDYPFFGGRPLLPPLVHPEGALEVSVDGQLALRGDNSRWVQRFRGWANCYGGNGEILARPSVDPQGNVYLATRLGVHSWDVAGRLRWYVRRECTSAVFWHQEALFFMDAGPALVRMSPATGEVLERVPMPAGPASDLALEKQLVAVALRNGEVKVITRPAPPGG